MNFRSIWLWLELYLFFDSVKPHMHYFYWFCMDCTRMVRLINFSTIKIVIFLIRSALLFTSNWIPGDGLTIGQLEKKWKIILFVVTHKHKTQRRGIRLLSISLIAYKHTQYTYGYAVIAVLFADVRRNFIQSVSS